MKRAPHELLALAIVARACDDLRLKPYQKDAKEWIEGPLFADACRVAGVSAATVTKRLRAERLL